MMHMNFMQKNTSSSTGMGNEIQRKRLTKKKIKKTAKIFGGFEKKRYLCIRNKNKQKQQI